MIYRCVCYCPNQHPIEALVTNLDKRPEDEREVCEAMATTLKNLMDLWILDGKLGDICEVCKAPKEQFTFEVNSLDVKATKERMEAAYRELVPELMKQRARRHARKQVN